jgi:hypothetical protein
MCALSRGLQTRVARSRVGICLGKKFDFKKFLKLLIFNEFYEKIDLSVAGRVVGY